MSANMSYFYWFSYLYHSTLWKSISVS